MEIKLKHAVFFYRKKQPVLLLIRAFLFLFCAALFSFTPKNTISQNSKIKIGAAITLTIDEVFDLIKKQTDYTFIYEEGIFKDFQAIKVEKGTISTNKLLQKSLSQGNFNLVAKTNNTILIKEKDKVQQRQVTGKITDESGLPIAAATVQIKNTKNGTATDFDGHYSIMVTNAENVLLFSALGFATQEIIVGNQTVINVVLKEDVSQLDEVVVTGYQKIAKSRTTGSFAKIKNENLENIETLSIVDKIEGLVPGLSFDRDGRLVMRGVSTFRDGNAAEPLIVLDKHPIEPELLETINPDDIESITTLKDASAASIWGARAANGVIVIVSKKSKRTNSPLSINLSTSISFQRRPDLSESTGSTAALLELQEHQAKNGWASNINPLQVPPLGFDTYKSFYAGDITETEKNAIINRLTRIDLRKEFSRKLLRGPVRRKYSLSASGSGEKNAYYFSANYNEILQMSQGFSDKRLTLNANNIFTITPKLKISTGLTAYIKREEQNGYRPSAVRNYDQYDRILDENGNFVIDQIIANQVTDQKFPYDWGFNLKQNQQELDITNTNNTYRLNFGIDYDIKEYLNLTVNYQYNHSQALAKNLNSEDTFFTRNLLNNYTSRDDVGMAINNIPLGAILDETNSIFKSQTANAQLNFSKKFNKHDIVFLAGAEIREVIAESSRNRIYGYDPQSLRIDTFIDYTTRFPLASSPFAIGTIPFLSAVTFNEDRFLSTYFNLGYNYAQKYKFSASYRQDDSNLFGASPKYRNIPLWSLGIAWDITKEAFFDSKIIDKLIIRGTRGTGGNIDKTTSPFTILRTSSNARNFGNRLPYAYLQNPPNPTLRWEKTTTTNVGLDFSLLNNRLYGSVEYYDRQSIDLLADRDFNPTYGITEALYNVAAMSNKGVDVSLNSVIVKKPFQWISTLNFSTNKNNVESVSFDNENFFSYLSNDPRVGLPLDHIHTYRWAGLSSDGFSQVFDKDGNIVSYNEPRDFEIQDLVYSGRLEPKIYGGFTNTFTYKEFSLSTTLTYKFGHKFNKSSDLGYTNYSNRVPNFVPREFENRWQNPGDENITNVPRLSDDTTDLAPNNTVFYSSGSQNILDASHIRFKQLSFSYNLPKSIVEKLAVNSLQFGLQARDLGVKVFNDEGIDPENNSFNLGYIPTDPEFTFSINANF